VFLVKNIIFSGKIARATTLDSLDV
jgi:hypothetical protein